MGMLMKYLASATAMYSAMKANTGLGPVPEGRVRSGIGSKNATYYSNKKKKNRDKRKWLKKQRR